MSKELVFKSVFWSSLSILGVAFAMLLYVSYQDYVNPKHVFGSWIEIGAPNYQTEVLRFNEQGVYRNDRLISTNFEFDGAAITIRTGNGIFVYELSGTFNSPQLKRTQPINLCSVLFAKGLNILSVIREITPRSLDARRYPNTSTRNSLPFNTPLREIISLSPPFLALAAPSSTNPSWLSTKQNRARITTVR